MSLAVVENCKDSGTELVLISARPAEILFNLDAFQAYVRHELKAYDVVVTVDTVKDAKDLAADLNKKAKGMKDMFKEAAAKVTAPVDEMGKRVQELFNEFMEAREKLTYQIKQFESDRLLIVRQVLADALVTQYSEMQVRDEFRRHTVDSLVKLTALTPKNAISAATKASIVQMVHADLQMQGRTEARLLTLENVSLKAGLSAPLSRSHVESFLFADDAAYQARLDAIIISELEREAIAQESMRKKIEAEQIAKQQAEAKLLQQAVEAPVTQGLSYADRLKREIVQREKSLPYSDRGYAQEQAEINRLKQELVELEQPQPLSAPAQSINKAAIDLYVFAAIDGSRRCNPFPMADISELYAAGLSCSANMQTMVAIWSKNQGRIAVVDGLTGEVYTRTQGV